MLIFDIFSMNITIDAYITVNMDIIVVCFLPIARLTELDGFCFCFWILLLFASYHSLV